MSLSFCRSSLTKASLGVLLFASQAVLVSAQYSLTKLQGITAYDTAFLNDVGQVATNSAFWSNGTTTKLSESIPGFIAGLNNQGQVVGYSVVTFPVMGYIWQAGVMTFLPPLFPRQETEGLSINEKGEIVGLADPTPLDSSLSFHAVYWGLDRKPVDLGVLLGQDISVARAINDEGQILSTSASIFVATNEHTLIVTDASASSPLQFTISGSGLTIAGMTNSGLISGTVDSKAFFWREGKLTYILPFGAVSSSVFGFNNDGAIVGTYTTADAKIRPFVYDDGIVTDLFSELSPLLPTGASLTTAFDINNLGQILISDANKNLYIASPLASPVPEPASFAYCFALVAICLGLRKTLPRFRQ